MASVLVIEDEEMIRWSIGQTLASAGHEVTVCETAAEGMALFQRLRPEVVLLDLRLPDAHGATLLKAIKAENGPETAVIVMTAFEEDCPVEDAKRLGAFEYLKKPFDFNELDVIVRRALQTCLTFQAAEPGQRRRCPTSQIPQAVSLRQRR